MQYDGQGRTPQQGYDLICFKFSEILDLGDHVKVKGL